MLNDQRSMDTHTDRFWFVHVSVERRKDQRPCAYGSEADTLSRWGTPRKHPHVCNPIPPQLSRFALHVISETLSDHAAVYGLDRVYRVSIIGIYWQIYVCFETVYGAHSRIYGLETAACYHASVDGIIVAGSVSITLLLLEFKTDCYYSTKPLDRHTAVFSLDISESR